MYSSISLRYGSPYRRSTSRPRGSSIPSFSLPKIPTLSGSKIADAVKSMKFSFSFGPSLILASAVIFATSLVLISLFFSTREVTKGYVLRDLEVKRQNLMRESEVRFMQIAQAQALTQVLSSDRLDQMVPARHVEFMRGDTALASK